MLEGSTGVVKSWITKINKNFISYITYVKMNKIWEYRLSSFIGNRLWLTWNGSYTQHRPMYWVFLFSIFPSLVSSKHESIIWMCHFFSPLFYWVFSHHWYIFFFDWYYMIISRHNFFPLLYHCSAFFPSLVPWSIYVCMYVYL